MSFDEVLNYAVKRWPSIKQYLNDNAKSGVRFIPRGAEEPRLLMPDNPVAPEDALKAAALWDRLMPEYAGMLRATVIKKERFE